MLSRVAVRRRSEHDRKSVQVVVADVECAVRARGETADGPVAAPRDGAEGVVDGVDDVEGEVVLQLEPAG
jgi:hypothetical protein